MKRTAITLFCLAAAVAASAFADDQADFKAWMKTTGGTVAKLNKEVQAKAYSDIATDAATLEAVFKHVEDYFARTNTSDAVAGAQSGVAASKKLAMAAKASDADGVAAGVKAIQGTCHDCHTAHREKLPDGGFKMK